MVRCLLFSLRLLVCLSLSVCYLACGSDTPANENCVDNDGDGHGTNCSAGLDCDDHNPDCVAGDCCETQQCVDLDNDGYGLDCSSGPDCKDNDSGCYEGYCCLPILARLEIYPVDIWGQFLPTSDAQLSVSLDGNELAVIGDEIRNFGLRQAGSYQIDLSAPEHESLSITVTFDGSRTLDSAGLSTGAGNEGQGISFSHDIRQIDSQDLPVHSLYLGLRHKWFSAHGRPARRGNQVELLIGGEQAWARVYQSLQAASDSILMSSWWWMSDFELVRDWDSHAELSDQERWGNTVLGVLENSLAHVRVLVGEFWGSNSIVDWLTYDEQLKIHAETPGDDFEFMGQGNAIFGQFVLEIPSFSFAERVRKFHPESDQRNFDLEDPIPSSIPPYNVDMTDWPLIDLEIQIASWHQKFSVIDFREAFIGGMNVKSTDWDSVDHLVFDHRRMDFAASLADRQAVMDKERDSDLGPRRDYMLRIEGPAAQDAADVFQERWSQAITDQETLWDLSTDFSVKRDLAEFADGTQVQVTATMPAPHHEYAIAETWFNAVAQAQSYIFIEDQYWRVPWLTDAIVERMRQQPALKLMVITKEVDEWLDPGCEWTHRTHHQLLDEFGPSRYQTYVLKIFDWVVTYGIDETESRFVNIDTHSKMFIVDDKFMSIGSCNKNNRGLMYEGELNAAVLDPVFVRDQRRRILANLLPPDTLPSDEIDIWWQQFIEASTWNDLVYLSWQTESWDIDNGDGTNPLPAEYLPSGLVYSLAFGTVSDCFLEGVGPDMTFR